MLASYEEAKDRLALYVSPNTSWFLASIISGAIASSMSLPFDNVKTKLQKQNKLADGTLPYKSFLDCAVKTAANEGILGFWAGLPTYIVRIAPHVMITLIASEYLKKMFK